MARRHDKVYQLILGICIASGIFVISFHTMHTGQSDLAKVEYRRKLRSIEGHQGPEEYTEHETNTFSNNQGKMRSYAETYGNCSRHNHFYYTKVHKSGSSTLSTMFDRYGLRHNLTAYLLGYVFTNEDHKTLQQRRFLPPGISLDNTDLASSYHAPDFFIYHHMFNYEDAATVLPRDTLYIGSVRYPLSQFSSHIPEQNLVAFCNISNPTNMTSEILEMMMTDTARPRGDPCHYGTLGLKECISHDFGFPRDRKTGSTKFNSTVKSDFLAHLDRIYSEVTVMEYFDESLVMLRRRLCWNMQDILYMSQRTRTGFSGKKKYNFHPEISDFLQQYHRSLSPMDYAVYDHFKSRLFRQMDQEPDFSHELNTFKALQSKTSNFCNDILLSITRNQSYVYDISSQDIKIYIDPSPWGDPFFLHGLDCAVMRLETVVFVNLHKVHQYPELCHSPLIQRELNTRKVFVNMDWDRKIKNQIEFNMKYCDEVHPIVGVPLTILADRTAYMWL